MGATTAAAWLDASVAAAATNTTKRTTTKKKATKTTKKSALTTKPKAAGSTAPTTVAAASSSVAGTAAGDPNAGALATIAITFAGTGGTLLGSFAAPAKPRGAVMIIHENRGLTPHFVALPGRLARDGYAALSIDLASRVGGTEAVASQMPAPLGNAKTEDLMADLKSAIDELTRRAPGMKIGVMGFCFGGGMVWNLLASGEPRLSAAVPFYGTGPADADFSRSPNAAVLAVYAALDARVNANQPAMLKALEVAKLKHKVVTVAGVDHAFFNDTGARYQAAPAAQTYRTVLDWFGEHLA